MASFIRRSGKRGTTYQAKIRLLGYPPASETFSRLSDAKEWAAQVETDIRNGRYFGTREASRHTLEDLLDRYREYLKARSALTFEARRGHIAYWRNTLGRFALRDVTPSRIADARDALHALPTRVGKARSASDVNRHLATLSHAFSLATREWQWLEMNPLRRVQKLREPLGRVRFLSEDERARLLKACQESPHARWLYPLVVLALATGMRQGEILALTWDRVDLHRGWITLDNTKNRERRGVPLNGYALAAMREYAKVRRLDSDVVFCATQGDGPVYLRTAWTPAVTAAELDDFHFHDLRHTTASYLAMNGATPGEIAAVLGHRTLAMVKRYAHLSDAHVAGVLERMNSKMFGGN